MLIKRAKVVYLRASKKINQIIMSATYNTVISKMIESNLKLELKKNLIHLLKHTAMSMLRKFKISSNVPLLPNRVLNKLMGLLLELLVPVRLQIKLENHKTIHIASKLVLAILQQYLLKVANQQMLKYLQKILEIINKGVDP